MTIDATFALPPLSAVRDIAVSNDGELLWLLVATAALERRESRGAQFRSDYPVPSETAQHSTCALAEVRQRAALMRTAADRPSAGRADMATVGRA